MDQPEPFARSHNAPLSASSASPRPALSSGRAQTDPREAAMDGGNRLTLVSGRLVLASPDETVPADWDEAISHLIDTLGIKAERVVADRPASLMDRARRAMGAHGDPRAPVFAPWRCVSPASFQHGPFAGGTADFRWAASYLFDCAAGRGLASHTVDLVLMSPAPEMCMAEDASVGPVPRLAVINAMVAAAAREGRKKISIVTRETARNALAARLLGADGLRARSQMEIEILAIEEAAVRIQRGALDWEAIIAMPEMRGILFAMLAEASGIPGPWPMLWHDRDLACITGEGFGMGPALTPLDANLLMQSLALLARHGGCAFAADRLIEAWTALRDRGVVTAGRGASAPYVNQIDDGQFIAMVTGEPPRQRRALPGWKGIALEGPGRSPAPGGARLSLVASR